MCLSGSHVVRGLFCLSDEATRLVYQSRIRSVGCSVCQDISRVVGIPGGCGCPAGVGRLCVWPRKNGVAGPLGGASI